LKVHIQAGAWLGGKYVIDFEGTEEEFKFLEDKGYFKVTID
jgi:hypothetical protein